MEDVRGKRLLDNKPGVFFIKTTNFTNYTNFLKTTDYTDLTDFFSNTNLTNLTNIWLRTEDIETTDYTD